MSILSLVLITTIFTHCTQCLITCYHATINYFKTKGELGFLGDRLIPVYKHVNVTNFENIIKRDLNAVWYGVEYKYSRNPQKGE